MKNESIFTEIIKQRKAKEKVIVGGVGEVE